MTELKPCPFCGKTKAYDVYLRSTVLDPSTSHGYVNCHSCGSGGHIEHDSQVSETQIRKWAIEKWNTRPIEDALQARIDELEAENAALKEERRWRDPDVELPDVFEDVIIFDEKGDITKDFIVGMRDGKKYYVNSDDGVVSWMPLPEPPEVWGKPVALTEVTE